MKRFVCKDKDISFITFILILFLFHSVRSYISRTLRSEGRFGLVHFEPFKRTLTVVRVPFSERWGFRLLYPCKSVSVDSKRMDVVFVDLGI